MTTGFVLFLAFGRLLIFFGERFAKDNRIKIKFFHKLLSCSLCSGWWVYSILSFLTGYYIFPDWAGYMPIVSEVVTGSFSAYFVFLIEQGYKAIHEVVVI